MRRLGWLLVPLFASGCFLDRSAIAGDDAPDARTPQLEDAGPLPDAGRRLDAGSPEDAGEREDTGTPMLDGGPSCTATDERCDGQRALRCEGDVLTDEECLEACWHAPDGPRCVTCTPGATQCLVERATTEVCAADGSGWDASMDCPRGCDPGTASCRPETPCTDDVDATMAPGDDPRTFDLCDGEEDRTYNPAGDCDNADDTTEDVLVRLEIARAGTYRVLAEDAAVDGRRVDPVVYVRSACEDMNSQLGCHDDRNVTGDWLSAELEMILAPGDYFLIIDGYELRHSGRSYDCGDVRVTITEVSP